MAATRKTVDLSRYPDLVVIYLGLSSRRVAQCFPRKRLKLEGEASAPPPVLEENA